VKNIRALLPLLLLVATQVAFGQDEEAVTTQSEPQALPEELALDYAARIQSIEELEAAVVKLRSSYSDSEGVLAELYAARVDAMWARMFNETVRLAVDIAGSQQNGFDVSGFADDVERNLRVFPEESEAALTRLRSGVVFPDSDMAPAEIAVADQGLLRSIEKYDFVLNSMVTYLEVAEQLGIQDESEVDSLVTTLEEAAANRSSFLHIALDDVAVLRAAAATLPTDTDVAARLAVTEARVKIGAESLQGAVNLMNRLGLDTSIYRQQLVTTTGELSTDVLDVGGISGIVSKWTASLTETVSTEGPRLLFRRIVRIRGHYVRGETVGASCNRSADGRSRPPSCGAGPTPGRSGA